MRRSFKPKWLIADDGSLYGINIGADFCAEHEWGIKELNSMLGIESNNPKVFGVDKRSVRELPEKAVHFIDIKGKTGKTILAVVRFYRDDMTTKEIIERLSEAKPYKSLRDEKVPLGTAWDESSFCIWAEEELDREHLRKLHKSLMDKDLLIGFGITKNPFENPGLTICILSMFDEEVKKNMYDKDYDNFVMRETADKTGIKKVLEKAGKRYFALSPKWKDDQKKEIIFWLNPMEQHIHNHGWYGVEDLKLWAKNEGQVMIKKGT